MRACAYGTRTALARGEAEIDWQERDTKAGKLCVVSAYLQPAAGLLQACCLQLTRAMHQRHIIWMAGMHYRFAHLCQADKPDKMRRWGVRRFRLYSHPRDTMVVVLAGCIFGRAAQRRYTYKGGVDGASVGAFAVTTEVDCTRIQCGYCTKGEGCIWKYQNLSTESSNVQQSSESLVGH